MFTFQIWSSADLIRQRSNWKYQYFQNRFLEQFDLLNIIELFYMHGICNS